MTIQERFWSKVLVTENPLDCWAWTAQTSPDGYGRFQVASASKLAHRVAFEQVNGGIPAGLQLDHLCRNRACCNPNHLEPVTQRENISRGNSGLPQLSRTHCPASHAYDAVNTYVYKGSRICKECTRDRVRKRRANMRGEQK